MAAPLSFDFASLRFETDSEFNSRDDYAETLIFYNRDHDYNLLNEHSTTFEHFYEYIAHESGRVGQKSARFTKQAARGRKPQSRTASVRAGQSSSISNTRVDEAPTRSQAYDSETGTQEYRTNAPSVFKSTPSSVTSRTTKTTNSPVATEHKLPARAVHHAMQGSKDAIFSTEMSQGTSEYNLLGGTVHPGGKPGGMSKGTGADRTASVASGMINSALEVPEIILHESAEQDTSALELNTQDANINIIGDIVQRTTEAVITAAPSNSWDYAKFFERKILQTTKTWNVIDPIGTTLVNVDLDQELSSNTSWNRILSGYTMYSYDNFVITVAYETSQFYGGVARAVAVQGFGWKTAAVPNVEVLESLMNTGDGVELYANEKTQLELRIPWWYNKDYKTTRRSTSGTPDTDGGTCGQFYLFVLNTLMVPEGATQSITLTVSVSLEGIKLVNPCPPGVGIVSPKTYFLGPFPELVAPTTVGAPINTANWRWSEENIQERIVHQSHDSQSEIRYFPTTSRFQGHVPTVKMFGAKMPNSSMMDGSDMMMSNLTSRFGLFSRGTLDETLGVGGLVTTLVSTPNGQTGPYNDQYSQIDTPLKFGSMFAQHWSGSILYKMVLSKTVFTKGKLIVAWTPFALTAIPTVNTMTRFPYRVYDLAEVNEIIFRSPNQSSCPARTMPFKAGSGVMDERVVPGYFHIMVYSPLVSSSGIARLDWTIWHAGYNGDAMNAFRLWTPAYSARYSRDSDTNRVPDPRIKHQGVEEHAGPVASGLIAEAIGEDVSAGGAINLEPIDSIMDLLSRAQTFEFDGNTIGSNFPTLRILPHMQVTRSTSTYYMKYFNMLFANWSGDINYMLSSDVDVMTMREVFRPGNGTSFYFGGGPGMVKMANVQSYMTGTWVGACPNNFYLTPGYNDDRNSLDASVSQIDALIDSYDSHTLNQGTRVFGYVSAAENFTFSGYMCIPPKAAIGLHVFFDGLFSTLSSRPGLAATAPQAQTEVIRHESAGPPNIEEAAEIVRKMGQLVILIHNIKNVAECNHEVPLLMQASISVSQLESLQERFYNMVEEYYPTFPKVEVLNWAFPLYQSIIVIDEEIGKINALLSSWSDAYQVYFKALVPDFQNARKQVRIVKVILKELNDENPRMSMDFRPNHSYECALTGENCSYKAFSEQCSSDLNGDERVRVLVEDLSRDMAQIKIDDDDVHNVKVVGDNTIVTPGAERVWPEDQEVIEHQNDELEIGEEAKESTPGFFRSLRQVPENINAAMSALTSTGRVIPQVEKTLTNVNERLDSVEDIVAGAIEKTFCGSLDSTKVSLVIVLAIDAAESLLVNTKAKWISFAVKLGISIGVSVGLLKNAALFIWEKMRVKSPGKLVEDSVNEEIAHEALNKVSVISGVIALAVMALGFTALGGTAFNKKRMENTWDFLSVRGRDMMNVTSGVKAGTQAFENVQEVVMDCLTACVFDEDENISDKAMEKKILEEMKWISNEAADLLSSENYMRLIVDSTLKDRFYTMYDRKQKLFKQLMNCTVHHSIMQKFNILERNVGTLVSAALQNCSKNDIRVDPFHISIYGDPGVGKSFCSYDLANVIADSQEVPPNNRIYTRTEGMDFYDNYEGQFAFCRDDADMSEDPKAAADQIQRKSNVPVVLNMADLKKKGIYFVSKLLISTTNHPYPKPKSIFNHEAYWRRRDILVRAHWAGEDHTKAADFSHMRFTVRDPLTESVNGLNIPNLTYEQFVCYSLNKYSEFMMNQCRLIRGMSPNVTIDPVHIYPPMDRDNISPSVQAILTARREGRVNALAEIEQNFIRHEGGYISKGPSPPKPEEMGELLSTASAVAIIKEGLHVYIEITHSSDGSDTVSRYKYDWKAAGLIMEMCAEKLSGELSDSVAAMIAKNNDIEVSRLTKVKNMVVSYGLACKKACPTQESIKQFLSSLKMDRISFYLTPFLAHGSCVELDRLSATFDWSFHHDMWISTAIAPRKLLYRYIDWMESKCSPLSVMQIEFAMMFYTAVLAVVVTFCGFMGLLQSAFLRAVSWIWEKIMGMSPWAKVVLGVVSASAVCYWIYSTFFKSTEIVHEGTQAAGEIQDENHSSIFEENKGKTVFHMHVCKKCAEPFAHKHVMSDFHNGKYLMCNKCMWQKISNNTNAVQGGLDHYIHPWDADFVDYLSEKDIELAKKFEFLYSDITHESLSKTTGKKAKKNTIKFESAAALEAIKAKTISTFEKEGVLKLLELELKDEIKHEGTADQGASDIEKKVRKNIGVISLDARSCNYIGLKGLQILVPLHIFKGDYTRDFYTVTILRVFGSKTMDFNIKIPRNKIHFGEVHVSHGMKIRHDMAVIDLSFAPSIPAFQDVTGLFMKEHEVSMVEAGGLLLSAYSTSNNTHTLQLAAGHKIVKEAILGDKDAPKTWMAKGVSYTMSTEGGMCGGPLIAMNVQMARKLVGMHIGGGISTNKGYGIFVTSEILNKLLFASNFSNAPDIDEIVDHQCLAPIVPEEVVCKPEDNTIYLGKSEKTYAAPLKTDIIPSPLYDLVYQHTTEPAVLVRNDPRCENEKGPLHSGLQKFTKKPTLWDTEKDDIIVEHLARQFILATMKDYKGPTGILTMDEAVNGVPGFIDPLNMRTSPGFPYVGKRPSGSIGKEFLFEKVGERENGQPLYEMGPELKNDVVKILVGIKRDRVCLDNYYLDWMKDERRPLEKIKAGKTRLFNIHSCAWLIVMRMYYGAANAAYTACRLKVGSTLGINMFGAEVTELVQKLRRVGNNNHDGDVGKWDGTFDGMTAHGSIKVLAIWYIHFNGKDFDSISLVVCGHSLFWRVHICGRLWYIPCQGMPSGNFLTALLNTLGHNYRKYQIFAECAMLGGFPWLGYPSVADENIEETKNGDDSVGSASDEVSLWYNPEMIEKVFNSHGIEYQPPSKKSADSIEMFRDVEEIQYLKCHFKEDETTGFWMMQMNLDTIRELVNWIRKGQNIEDAMISNLQDAARFLVPHGEEVYRQFVDDISAVDQMYALYIPCYQEMYGRWREEHGL